MRTDLPQHQATPLEDPASVAFVVSSLQRRGYWFILAIRSGFRQEKECFSIAIDLFPVPLQQQQ
jgi:hypothetical protein